PGRGGLEAALSPSRPRPRPLRRDGARQRQAAAGPRSARPRRALRHPQSGQARSGDEGGGVTTERNHLSPLLLAPPQVEALRQLAGLASSDAARSLGRLLGTSVDAEVPRAQVAPRGGVSRVLQPDGPAFAVHFTVEGGARLRWLLHFTEQGATLMGGLLLGQPVLSPLGDGVPMYTSALAEAANIVVSSYVGGGGAAVGVTLVPSIPHVEVG